MTTVVKVGGALLTEPANAAAALRRIIDGPTVIVHGAGVQISRMVERLNTKSTFIDGLRVTDQPVLHAVQLALVGEVHTVLVQALQSAGLPAVGLFGGMSAEKKAGSWGFVGCNLKADVVALNALLAAGKIPVVPTLALGAESLLNVNGDETAAAVAVDLQADRLTFMTDVAGVHDAVGTVIRSARVDQLIGASFISGGMLPKLRAVKRALSRGVRSVSVGETVFEAEA